MAQSIVLLRETHNRHKIQKFINDWFHPTIIDNKANYITVYIINDWITQVHKKYNSRQTFMERVNSMTIAQTD